MLLQPFQVRKRFEDICEFLSSQIVEIEADSRYRDKPALIQVNAPLALIQVEMKAKLVVLKQIQKITGRKRDSASGSSTG